MSNLSVPGEGNVQNLAQVYEKRFNRVELALGKLLASGATTLHKIDIDVYDSPAENEVVIDWPRNRFCFFHDGEWICTPGDPEHAIKVYGDKKSNKVEDGAFRFSIAKSLHNYEIIHVEGFNGVAASGTTLMQLANKTRNIDILSTRVTIPSGAYSSDAGAPIRTDIVDGLPANYVRWKDRMWIDVDAVGSGGKGLGMYIRLRPGRIDVI